jgi:hypothetical protein
LLSHGRLHNGVTPLGDPGAAVILGIQWQGSQLISSMRRRSRNTLGSSNYSGRSAVDLPEYSGSTQTKTRRSALTNALTKINKTYPTPTIASQPNVWIVAASRGNGCNLSATHRMNLTII